ncbi:hypothetical protein Tco_0179074 [Tanacetum coccineum]
MEKIIPRILDINLIRLSSNDKLGLGLEYNLMMKGSNYKEEMNFSGLLSEGILWKYLLQHSFETESESVSDQVNVQVQGQPLKDNETHKANRKNWNDMMKRELGEGYSFTKKKCFVCGSLSHLIKDCDYYEKKMAREAEVKRVVNTGNGMTKPVWTNANRINHSNNFVPRSVQLNAGRPKFNSVRPNISTGRTNISSGRPKVNTVSPKVNTVSPKVNTVRPRQPAPHTTSNSMSPKRPQMNQINQRKDFSSYSSVRRPFAKSTAQMTHTNAVMGSWGSAVKTSASYNWRNSRPNFNYNSGPTFIRTVNANGPQGRPFPHVTPKISHLNAVKRIFKYLKGKPNLGLWYPRESPFDLEAFSDSDYGGSNLDRKSTTGGCQFLGQRLISWQCKKQTIVATSTTEAEYVAAANCCGQVLWVQNQLLDYGFNFMNTKIHIDNESTICIVKNPVYHSKTKHIEIRHHFIRDCYEKKLISVEKIHTDLNVADLLTKPFDGPRFNYLVVSIGFAEIVDFLRGSNLRYALTTNPTIYDSLVQQFWQTATANTKADGSLEINATIDTIRYTISEASIRDSLQLEDATGITMLPNDELFEGMGQIGYPTDGTFTFWKSFFTPQWRYLVHHLLHCISSKSGGWDQFGSNIATALICLSTGRVYNFSKLIFDGMVANLKSKTKFLMGFRGAPRPLLPSMLLVATNPNAGQEHAAVAQSQPSSSSPQVPSPQPIPTPTPPPIPTPTPPPIPTPTPPPIPTPTPPPIPTPTPTPIPDTEPTPLEHIYEEQSPVHHHFSPPQEQAPSQMPMDDLLHEVPKLISRIDSLETDLKQTKLTMGNAIVKLVKKVKKLEGFLKRRNLVLSDSEEEEPEVQGRKSSREEQVEDISPNTLEAAKTLSKVASLKPRSIDKGRRYKRRKETKGKKVVSSLDFQEEVDAGAEQVNTAEGVSTGSTKLSTGSEQVSTVGDKKSTPSPDKGQRAGKAPMIIEETPKKSKEQILQEEASLAEAIRLDTLQKEEVAKQVHLDSLLAQRIAEEEELNEQQKKRKAQVQFEAQHYTDEDWDLIRAKIEANAELSKSMLGSDLQGEDFAKKMVDLVNQRKKYFAEERARAKRNKPMTQSQLKTYMMNYLKNQGTWKLSQLKNLSFEEVKKEFDKLVKQVESFAPINFEATKASLKRFGEELQTKTSKRLKDDEAKDAEPAKKFGKRRKQIARKGLHTDLDKDDSEDSDEVDEQEESVTGTKILINPVPVAMKSPSIATYKIIKQGEKGVYQIVREDGTDIVYINFGAMLKDISRDDLTELYRIVMNRYGMDGPEDNSVRSSLDISFSIALKLMNTISVPSPKQLALPPFLCKVFHPLIYYVNHFFESLLLFKLKLSSSIHPVPVAIKPSRIATYKIIKQGEKGVYQIVREDGTDIVYINFGAMVKDISRDDLTELYRIVMNRYGMNGPEDELEKSMDIYMLIERQYPLSAEVCKAMLDKKLQGGKPFLGLLQNVENDGKVSWH